MIAIFSHKHKLHEYILYLGPISYQKLKIVGKLKQSNKEIFFDKVTKLLVLRSMIFSLLHVLGIRFP